MLRRIQRSRPAGPLRKDALINRPFLSANSMVSLFAFLGVNSSLKKKKRRQGLKLNQRFLHLPKIQKLDKNLNSVSLLLHRKY